MPYQVINVDTNEPVNNLTYDTAQDAAAARGVYSFRTRIQAITDPNDNSWVERERIRLEDGTYTPVPSWFELYCKTEHFVHLAQGSTLSDGMLAFTENPTKGQLDLQLKLSVSKYLARYCDWMSGDRIRDIAGKFAADTYTLTIEQTEEAFIFTYEGQEVCSESSSHVSCMAKYASDYGTPIHPAAVYYTGTQSDSLAIAYIRDPKDDSKVLARALVWPDKKTFVKLYGTSEAMRITLCEKLEAAGFTRGNNFSGARLKRIEMRGSAGYVMPYIDGNYQYVDGHGDYFEIVGSGEYSATETRGYIYNKSRYTCDNCGAGMDDDDTHDVQGATWCEHCYENHTFFCERTEETYSEDHDSNEVVTMVQYRYSDPSHRRMTQTWSQDACDNYAIYCERDETYYDSRYFNSVDVTTRSSRGAAITEIWCAEETSDGYFICPDCGKAYTHDFMSSTHNDDGEMVCTDCAEKRSDDGDTFKLSPVSHIINDQSQHVLDFYAACAAA